MQARRKRAQRSTGEEIKIKEPPKCPFWIKSGLFSPKSLMRSIWLLFLNPADLKARNEYEKRDVHRRKLWFRRVSWPWSDVLAVSLLSFEYTQALCSLLLYLHSKSHIFSKF